MTESASFLIAPYITGWSAEQDLPSRLVEFPGRGIGYADELPGDRDTRGVLWQRAAVCRGMGKPDFAVVHPLRQRRAMRRLLCQVCAGPADRNEDGVLWLLRDLPDRSDWPERMACTEPPVCVPCVQVSLRLCPAMRRGAVAFRVGEYAVAGVKGVLYRKGVSGFVKEEAIRAYEDPDVRWMIAFALIRELLDCTLVPLDELVGQHAR